MVVQQFTAPVSVQFCVQMTFLFIIKIKSPNTKLQERKIKLLFYHTETEKKQM